MFLSYFSNICYFYRYVYTDNVQFSSVEEACDVLYAAKKYMISNLSQLCHSYMKRNMQAKDVVAVYEYAKLLEEEALYEPCLLVCTNNCVSSFLSVYPIELQPVSPCFSLSRC